MPSKSQHSPSRVEPIKYGQKIQQVTPEDMSPQLSKEGIEKIQRVVGTCAWYSRAADPTMAKTLILITGRQADATEDLDKEVKHFVDYLCGNASRNNCEISSQ